MRRPASVKDIGGDTFSGRVAFNTYSSSSLLSGDKCERRPKSALIKLVEANGIEKDRASLGIASEFKYNEELGRYTANSDVVLHGWCQSQCEGASVAVPACWRKVDAGPFSLLAPPGWEFHQLDGSDSYIGEFVGNSIVLRFDYGGYSDPLKEERKAIYIVIHKSIDGHAAKIVNPRVPGHGITGVYFRNAGNASALTLFGKDLTPTQQELALKIFETLRFGGPVPR